jgi:predicted transposase/invertase (TIGR01784 family)
VTNQGLSEAHKTKVSEIIDQYSHSKEVSAMISNLEKAFEDFEFKAELKGIEAGKAKGKAEGKAEGKLEVARVMLAKGVDISFIAEMTGLTKEAIEKLSVI